MKEIQVLQEVPARGLFGRKKTKLVKKTIEVDDKTYKTLKAAQKKQPYTFDEMYMYDVLDGEE